MEARKASLDHIAARVLELNVRYYRALGEATVDYIRSLFSFVGDVTPLRSALMRASSVAPPATEASRPAASAAAIVLEAPAGETAEAGFVVNNRLSHRVSASFTISAFQTDSGEIVSADVAVHPNTVTLDPGAQMVVRVGARITESFVSGESYRGTISVPGIADTPIGVILRRRAEPAPAPAPAPAASAPAAPKPRATAARRQTRRNPRRRK